MCPGARSNRLYLNSTPRGGSRSSHHRMRTLSAMSENLRQPEPTLHVQCHMSFSLSWTEPAAAKDSTACLQALPDRSRQGSL